VSNPLPHPRPKPTTGPAQLAAVLAHEGVDAVIDVGANVGQYGRMLRSQGWQGPILSFEPLAKPREALARAAAGDPLWRLAPPLALGDTDGEVRIAQSAESDMSSILEQSALLRSISPSSAVVARQTVASARLDGQGHLLESTWRRLHLKVDVQGYEPQVVAGAAALLPRIATIQLELALLPVYEGERGWREMVDRLDGLGFAPALVLPGYFERKLARMVQIDMVFARKIAGGKPPEPQEQPH
jgi:FkbM family methyltransferase